MTFIATPIWTPEKFVADYGSNYLQIGDVLIQRGTGSNNSYVTYPFPYSETQSVVGTVGGFATTVSQNVKQLHRHRCGTFQYSSPYAATYYWWAVGKTARRIPESAPNGMTLSQLLSNIQIVQAADAMAQIAGFGIQWDNSQSSTGSDTFYRSFLTTAYGIGTIPFSTCTACRVGTRNDYRMICYLWQNAECLGSYSRVNVGEIDPGLLVPTPGLGIEIASNYIRIGNFQLEWGNASNGVTISVGPYQNNVAVGAMADNAGNANSCRSDARSTTSFRLSTWNRTTAVGTGNADYVAAGAYSGTPPTPGVITYV